jgi:adenine-specific DNA-methyltransferase
VPFFIAHPTNLRYANARGFSPGLAMMKKHKYVDCTKEDLIKRIAVLEKYRYGLVWEDKQENVAEQCDRELPVLHEDILREIKSKNGLPQNILIEGDNYHALYALNFTHKRKVDVIYIDPPYNTGNKSWRYNNNFVEQEDPYKHSKWVSFMNKRLRLAKNLLKDAGIIICAIDDYEVHNLRHLMDKIFGEDNRLGTCVVVHNPGGRQDDKYFPTAHEYMLVYAKRITNAQIGRLVLSQDKIEQFKNEDAFGRFKLRGFRRSGANSRREDRPNLYYPIYYNVKTKQLTVLKRSGWIELLPIDDKGVKRCWRWNSETFMEKIEKYIDVKKVRGEYDLYVKEREDDNVGEKAKTIWSKPKYAAVGGTHELKQIFNNTTSKIFDYPKSLCLLNDVLKITTKSNSVVLDFFAGSGTTGHAVLELNQQDDGNRQFILCTNNENNICEEVTYPRIKKVIEGYNNNKPIPANLKYYKTEFVPQVITDNDKRVLVSRSTELLCLAENTFDLMKQSKRKMEYAIYQNTKQMTAIIYDEDAIEKCKDELRALKPKEKMVIYVFSYDHEYNEEDFDDLDMPFEVKPIPEAILNVYRRNARLKRK